MHDKITKIVGEIGRPSRIIANCYVCLAKFARSPPILAKPSELLSPVPQSAESRRGTADASK